MVFQLGAPLLDACVLAVLAREDTYGYILTQEIKLVMNISESTLYPVLRRLQKDGCLDTYDKPFAGRNRRYYTLTKKGKEVYQTYQKEWEQYKASVDLLLGGNQNEFSQII